MAKGFSFVLVTVVMIMMMVFGMLSLSSTKADLRLSEKAASAQQTYYGMDADGERLYSDCNGAASAAWSQAKTFAGGTSARTLPDDLYSCLIPLAGRTDSAQSSLFLRGVFFYELDRQLAGTAKSDGFSYRIDADALSRAVRSGESDIPVAYVTATVTSKLSPNNSLRIALVCDFGSGSSVPSFRKTQWESSVSAPTVSDSGQTVHVWGGQ